VLSTSSTPQQSATLVSFFEALRLVNLLKMWKLLKLLEFLKLFELLKLLEFLELLSLGGFGMISVLRLVMGRCPAL